MKPLYSASMTCERNPSEMDVKRAEMLRRAGHVSRMHTIQTVKPRPISEHVYGASCIAVELCLANRIHPGHVLMVMLIHDAPELKTGDAPAPTKRLPGMNALYRKMEEAFYEKWKFEIPDLMELEAMICKASDYIDLAYTCLEERRLGNKSPDIAEVLTNAIKYVKESCMWVSGVDTFINRIEMEWNYV